MLALLGHAVASIGLLLGAAVPIAIVAVMVSSAGQMAGVGGRGAQAAELRRLSFTNSRVPTFCLDRLLVLRLLLSCVR